MANKLLRWQKSMIISRIDLSNLCQFEILLNQNSEPHTRNGPTCGG